MTKPSSIEDLVKPMVDREVDLDAAAFRVDRAKVLARMARVRAERRPRPYLAAFAIAAGVAMAFGAWKYGGSKAESAMAIEGAQMDDAGEILTSEATARVRTNDGVELDVGSHTRVALKDLAEHRRVRLSAGSVRFDVPHRPMRAPLRIEAGDVTIEDLGTVFTVTVDEAPRTTRVDVTEGEVMVKSASTEARVGAGQSWSSAPAPPRVSAQAAPSASAAPSAAASVRAPFAAPRAPAPKGTLDEESRLLRNGLSAERSGDFAGAARSLRELLAKYPRSPLAPDARAALARVETRLPH